MLGHCILCYVLSAYFSAIVCGTNKNGLLLLYRPLDISNECAFSGRLRYDLSFGMGMSDTITMVLRTINGIDYECNIEITAQSEEVFLVVVIKFPTNLLVNCYANEDAFMVMKKNKCLRLCELLGDRNIFSPYYVITVRGRIRFRFLSNSSINSEINAAIYQVTATTARVKPKSQKCQPRNETLCVIDRQEFCFTSGVVCDGIKHCGVGNWFDERQSECSLPIEYLGYAPVIAVVAVLACALLAAGHILLRCLPPLASSFFIFNANEDNRLCIDPILHPPNTGPMNAEKIKRISLIPVISSTSSYETTETDSVESTPSARLQSDDKRLESDWEAGTSKKLEPIVRVMTAKIQNKLRYVTGRGQIVQESAVNLKIDQV